MIRPPILLLSVLTASLASAQTLPVKEHVLSNGMRVLMVERHDEPTIACGWLAKVGSANETAGQTGLAHLFEHMMFKGTTTIGTRDAKRDAELNAAQDEVQAQVRQEMSVLRERQRRGEIADLHDPKARTPRLQQLLDRFDALVKEQRSLIVKDEMDKIYKQAGATGLNASTSQDRTFYIIQIPSNKLELWSWIESDRIAHPVFREFYSERNVILEERRQTLESRPEGLVGEAFNAMTWMASPYHWEVIGWPSDISQVTREQANAFFTTWYAPNNLTAILVGDFKAEQAVPMLERYFGRIPANPKNLPEIITSEPRQPAEQRMVAVAETSPSLEIAFKAVPAVHRDAPALQVLASVLGGGGGGMRGGARSASGRLTKALVLGQKAATSVSASARGQKLGGLFTLRATPAPGRRPEDLEPLLYAEIQKVATEGITDQELAKVKQATQLSSHLRLETNTGIRDALAQAEATGTYQDLLAAPERILAVTKADVQRVAQAYLVREQSSTLVTTRKGGGGRRKGEQTRTEEVK